MEGASSTDVRDPQFMKVLKECLESEIARLKRKLASVNANTKMIQAKCALKWKESKELDQRIREIEENTEVFHTALKSLDRSTNRLRYEIELSKANLDDAYKVIAYEEQRHQAMLDQYKDTWQQYEIMYEELPLAKVRKEEKYNLEKLRIENMITEHKLNETDKKLKQSKRISWLRLRAKIIQFAEAVIENRQLSKKLSVLESKVETCKKELRTLTAELQNERKKKEEGNKMRTQTLLAAPVLKMYLPTIMDRNADDIRNTSVKQTTRSWRNNYDRCPDVDSISITTSLLEDIYINDVEYPLGDKESEVSDHLINSQNGNSTSALVEVSKNVTDEVQEEVHNFIPTTEMQEVDLGDLPIENRDSQITKANIYEKEQYKKIAQFHGNKIARQLSSSKSEVQEEPEVKRMRSNVAQDSEKSKVRVETPRSFENKKLQKEPEMPKANKIQTPRIVNVERVRVDLFSKLEQNFPQSSGRNTYCESAESSGVDFNLTNLGEDVSVYGGSFNFSECSNITMPFSMTEDADIQSSSNNKINLQSKESNNNLLGLNSEKKSNTKTGRLKLF